VVLALPLAGLCFLTAPGSASTSTAKHTPSRFVYCLGGPSWVHGGQNASTPGWWFGGTSTGWMRSAADGSPALAPIDVRFDDSVKVMHTVRGSYGSAGGVGPCRTVAVAIGANDPPSPGVSAGAQASVLGLTDNATNPFYGARPPISPQQGETWFYGFAAATNAGYVPYGSRKTDLALGNWNSFGLELHSTIGLMGPVMEQVATIGPRRGIHRPRGSTSYVCNSSMVKLAQPRLEVALTGGSNDRVGNDGGHTCLRFQGPVFRAGAVYRVAYQVKWDAFGQGLFRWWVDSGDGRGYVLYADVSGVSTLWRDASNNVDTKTYPELLNYRKADSSLPTSIMYYGGLIRGSTLADVVIPGRASRPALKAKKVCPRGQHCPLR
jgi:hypothetical protein